MMPKGKILAPNYTFAVPWQPLGTCSIESPLEALNECLLWLGAILSLIQSRRHSAVCYTVHRQLLSSYQSGTRPSHCPQPVYEDSTVRVASQLLASWVAMLAWHNGHFTHQGIESCVHLLTVLDLD